MSRDMSYRNNFIGGTDMSRILGVSKYGDRETVFKEKLGQSVNIDNMAMRIGRAMEQPIADMYADTHETVLLKGNVTVLKRFMSDIDPLLYSLHEIDATEAYIVGSDGISGGSLDRIDVFNLEGVEIKTAPKAFKDVLELPEHYYVQIQHYMRICKKHVWNVAVVGKFNNSYNDFQVTANDALWEVMEKEAALFWDELIKRKEAL